MTLRSPSVVAALLGALLLAACGGEDPVRPSAATGGPPPSAGEGDRILVDRSPFLVPKDTPDAVSVFDAKELEAGKEVAVVGRVRDFVKGYAAFTLIDDELDYCGRGADTMDGCSTPWDYCCIQKETQAAASIPVEYRDAKGEPVEAKDLGLRLLDLVVIHGTLEKTESGGLLLVTNRGWHLRERPTLGPHVQWP
jgi:hypothetical protein